MIPWIISAKTKLDGAESIGNTMSERGAYGFLINGQMTVIYCNRGAYFSDMGNNLLSIAKNNTVEEIATAVGKLQVVESDEIPTDEELMELEAIHGEFVDMETRHPYRTEKDWYSYFYKFQCHPNYILSSGRYVDGLASLEAGSANKFLLLNLDKKSLEIYVWYPYAISNRKSIHEMIHLISYSFDSLPETLSHLEEDQWDLMGDWVRL